MRCRSVAVLLALVSLAASMVVWAGQPNKTNPNAMCQDGGKKIGLTLRDESVGSSTVSGTTPATLNTSVPIDLCFIVSVNSPDYEYIEYVSVDLPDGWTVNSVANVPDSGCGHGTTQGVDPGNVVYWRDVNYPPATGCGSWVNGTYNFCCNVTLPDCTGAPFTLSWTIVGDGWGGAPHSTSGTVGPINCSAGPPTGMEVLLVSPDSTGGNISGLIAAINAYPGYIPVVWNNALGTPTAEDLAPYCVVIVGNDYTWESEGLDRTAIGNALAGYLDGGGHVIESQYVESYDSWGMAGSYISGGYSPFTPATLDYWSGDSMVIDDADHPVMAGVGSIYDNWGHQNPGLRGGASLLSHWAETGYNMVAVNSNVVAINQLLFHAASWTGDVPLLLHNALMWLCPAGCPTITIDPSSLPAAYLGIPYSQTISASGGSAPYTFLVTAGALPGGLGLAADGTLSGTPDEAGLFSFTITATDDNECEGTMDYDLGATCPTISIFPPPPLSWSLVGTPYYQLFVAFGGTAPYVFAYTGTLPPGLTFVDNGDGTSAISGTPTGTGAFDIEVTVTDAYGCEGGQTYTAPAFNVQFEDDVTPVSFCVDFATGLYAWGVGLIVPPFGVVPLYTGRAEVMNGGSYIWNGPADPNFLYVVYDPVLHRAYGYYYDTQGSMFFSLFDSDTTDNSGICPGRGGQTD